MNNRFFGGGNASRGFGLNRSTNSRVPPGFGVTASSSRTVTLVPFFMQTPLTQETRNMSEPHQLNEETPLNDVDPPKPNMLQGEGEGGAGPSNMKVEKVSAKKFKSLTKNLKNNKRAHAEEEGGETAAKLPKQSGDGQDLVQDGQAGNGAELVEDDSAKNNKMNEDRMSEGDSDSLEDGRVAEEAKKYVSSDDEEGEDDDGLSFDIR
jgi:hypothetical protein